MSNLKVFYDGKCHVCYLEIAHYHKKDKHQKLELIDISTSDFDPQNFGLDEDVHINMTSTDNEGNIYKGVDTFIEIWKRVPPYNKLIPVFENRLLRPAIDLGYKVFAYHIRHRLPKRKCDDGTCSVY